MLQCQASIKYENVNVGNTAMKKPEKHLIKKLKNTNILVCESFHKNTNFHDLTKKKEYCSTKLEHQG